MAKVAKAKAEMQKAQTGLETATQDALKLTTAAAHRKKVAAQQEVDEKEKAYLSLKSTVAEAKAAGKQVAVSSADHRALAVVLVGSGQR